MVQHIKIGGQLFNIDLACETHTIQAVVQDVRTKQILRVGFVNDEALSKMEETKEVYMLNAEQSGLEVITGGEYFKPLSVDSLVYNTDKSAVIIKALPEGSTTGADTFRGDKNLEDLAFLSYLQDFIEKRKREMPEGSYTTKLFTKGLNKISQKVGEEAVETVIEATNGTGEQFLYESSDLIYHLIVLLTEKGYRIEDLARELKARHKE
ncbi:MAG: phosphoribosyl-ATP diphosphatase [Paludibacteraceae bacterium]|nr:phosphoribosyl-ATP diphosphatase [Paludibacteraceae bacterium]